MTESTPSTSDSTSGDDDDRAVTVSDVHDFSFVVIQSALAMLVVGAITTYMGLINPVVFAVGALVLLGLMVWALRFYYRVEQYLPEHTDTELTNSE